MKIFLLTLIATIFTISSFSIQASGETAYNTLGCVGCHGVGGKSVISIYPVLAGQDAASLVKKLKDYQSGARKNSTMNVMAPLTVGKEQIIADYLAAQ